MNISDDAQLVARKVLAKCAATDPWFPRAADVTVLAWAEQFAIAKIPVEDLLAGVTASYAAHGSGFKPLPADIIKAAREIRRDRLQRTDPAERGHIEAIGDRKAVADVVNDLATAKAIPADDRPIWRRTPPNELTVRCPWCEAPPGNHCVIPRTNKRVRTVRFHEARIEALAATQAVRS